MNLTQLYKTALISSPVLAVYGLVPVFIFNRMENFIFFQGFLFLTFNLFIVWLINIWIIKITTPIFGWRRYLTSYLIVIVLIFLSSCFAVDFLLRDLPFIEGRRIYPFINGIAINTIILIISNVVLLKEKKDNAELRVQNLEFQNMQAQQQLMMQQFQPHFLFNALSTLKSLLRSNPDEAEEYILKLSDFLRFSIQAHQNSVVTLEKEMKFTQEYMEMQQIRFSDSMECNMQIPLDVLQYKIPVFALQSLVENAIKHNGFTTEKTMQLRIEYLDERIKITNNKIPKKGIESSGTGLDSLNQRHRLLTGESILIEETEEEFSVTLKLIAV